MTSRYRVEYALKTHRRDELIEWMKGLTAVPFVLNAGAGSEFLAGDQERSVSECRRKYGEIFVDVEKLIAAEFEAQRHNTNGRLRRLVPTIGHFFTTLPLERAFYAQDAKRAISRRRLVAPSFNDHRLILNTAQAMALASPHHRVRLVTFDGDVTLYEDGQSLGPDDPVISRLLALLGQDIAVGIVTAAGYPDPDGALYYERLRGLIDAVQGSDKLTPEQKERLLVMGGECNYLFRLNFASGKLECVPAELWTLPEQASWSKAAITEFLDAAQSVLERERWELGLDMAKILRKERSVGLIPISGPIPREALEEVVLMCQHTIQASPSAEALHFTAFNGGSDVWCDIGDKRFGVLCLQKFLGGIPAAQTLHVGDQFASLGANDFKARLAACTVWICSPRETVDILDELLEYLRRIH